MDTTPKVVDQVRRALSRKHAGKSRSWTRSATPPPAPATETSMRRRSSFVRSAARYVTRPPER